MRTQIPGKQILDEAVDTPDLKDGAVTDEKLSTTGVPVGSYTKVTVNEQGRVTGAENPTTLDGYGITDAFSIQLANQVPFITADLGQLENQGSSSVDFSASTFRVLRGIPGETTIVDGGALAPITVGFADNAVFPGTGGITVPHGTSAERLAAPAEGAIRYNDETESLETFSEGDWYSLIDTADKRLRTMNTLYVQKDPGAGQFSSVKQAIDSITDAGTNKRYVIRVAGGTYEEDPIVMKRYTAIVGDNATSVIIRAKDPNSDLITAVNDGAISSVTLSGTTGTVDNRGAAALYFHNAIENDNVRSFVANDIRFGATHCCVRVTTVSNFTSMYVFNGQFGGSMPYNHAIHVESTGGGQARVLLRASTTRGASSPTPESFAYVSGPGSEIFLNGCQLRTSISAPEGIAIRGRDGAMVRILSSTFRGFHTGVLIENAGAASKLYGYNIGLESNVRDVVIEHEGTTGTLQGSWSHSKLFVPTNLPNLSMNFMDAEDAGIHIVGKFNLAPTVAELTDITDLITQTAPMGLISGGVVTRATGTTVTASPGTGYLRNSAGNVQHVIFNGGNVTLPPGSTPYIYIDANGSLLQSNIAPSLTQNILLARVMVGASSILLIGDISLRTPNLGNTLDTYLRNTIGPVFVSGSIVTENATVPRGLDISAGEYWFGTNIRKPNGLTNFMFFDGFKVNGQVALVPKTVVPNDTITDPTSPDGMKAMTPGYFAKHALYQSGSGSDLLFILSHASEEYPTIEEVYAAPIPIPVLEPAGTPHIAAIIVQQGANNLVDIHDIRPKHFRAGAGGSSGGTSDHGELLGLGDDDHQQYLLANGSRELIGDLKLGGHNITNVGLIDGLNIEAHGDRHLPNGADPITTGPAVGISPTSVNATGVANALSRADHTHALFGVQPTSTRLTNFLAAPMSGFIVSTGANTWAARTITNPDGAFVITNADGVAGNIEINLANVGTPGTYVSVTTDNNGSVISGSTTQSWTTLVDVPTTIAGFGILDAQPLDPDLTALSNSGGTGFYIRTGDGTSVTRTFVQPEQGLTITNANGVGGSPTFTLANDLGALEALATTGIPVRVGMDTWALRSLVAPAAGLTITNPLGVVGNPTFGLANDLAAVEGLTTTGFAVRTSTDTWITQSLSGTAGNITVTNPLGVAGSPTINLATVGTAGTFSIVTTDAFGRVTSGSSPTTLAGYGITDAQPLDSDLTALANITVNGFYVNSGSGTAVTRTLTAGSNKVAIGNATGVAGNPTIDVVEANLALNNISGVLGTTKGGTALTTLGAANTLLGINATATAYEFKTLNGTANQTVITSGVGSAAVGLAQNPVLPGTGGVVLPTGTTAQRTASTGTMRLNSTTGLFEAFNGAQWLPLSSPNTLTQYFRGTVAPTAGTTIIPYGTVAPTSTQGTLLWSQTITPLDASSYIEVQFSGVGDLANTSSYLILSCFRGTTFIGMSILASGKQGTDFTNTLVINVIDMPATTTPVTYSVRAGASAGTWYLGRGQSATFGNAALSHWSVKEYS